ncbi:MAG: tetratricopeptide repeat protein [bacterium]
MADRVDVAADLAWARAAAGDVRLGVRLLEQAIASAAGPEGQQPRQVLRLRLARLHEELAGDLELARRAYREALRDGVRDPAVLERVERLASDARDWVTLAEVLRRSFEDARARRDGADTCKLGLRLGRLLRETLDQPVEATRVLLETYEQAPDDTDLFHLVAEGLAAHPDPAATIRLYGTRIASALLEPAERLAIGLRLVEAFSTEGRAAEAVEELDTLRALVPDDATVRAAVERLFPKAGRWADLVALYRAELRVADHAQYPVVLRKLARALEVGLRDLPAATEAWQALVEADPRDLEAVRSVARLLEAQRRFSELLLVSQREVALVAEPRQKAYIHFRIGTLHETHLGDLEAASAAYRTALKLDPRCFPALHGLRTIATDLGDWSRVLQLLGQELRLWDEPRERAAVLARMGDVHARHLGRADEAEACYRRAVDLWPACVPAARALADAAFEAGRFHEAAPLLQSLTQQKLDAWPPAARSDLFYKRGAAAMALGRVLEAIESLELALEFTPDHHEALRTLVKAVAQMGDAERLDALGARLDTVYAAHADAGREAECGRIDVLRGHVAQRALRLEQAEACYRAAAARRPHDLDAHLPLVMLHVRARRWVDATAVLRRFAEGLKPTLTDHRPDRERFVEALLIEADLWCDGAVDPGRAIECCRRVLQVEPRSRTALFRMAQAHFVKKEFAEARDVVQRALPLPDEQVPAPEHALYLFYLGRIHEAGYQDAPGAAELYQRALQIDPGCTSALLGLLRLQGRAGREAAVDRLLESGRALIEAPDAGDPVHAALKLHAAGIRLRRGDAAGAAALLTPLADGGGPRARDARFALAQVGLAQGDADAAARPLLRALDEDVTDTEALRALAELLGRHGDDERLFQVLSALELFSTLTAEEQARFEALQTRARLAGDRGHRALTAEELRRLVAHPSFQSPLVALVGLCEPALAERFPLADLEVPPRSALVTSRRHPFAPDARAVQALLDWRDFDAYLADAPEPIRLRPAPRAVVVIGGAGRGLTAAHQRFYLGRASAFGALGLGRLHDLGPERSLELLGLLAALFDRAQPDPLAALPPRAAEAVRALVAQAGGAPLPAAHTGEAVLSGIVRTADRVGLLAAGRLRAAVEGVAGIGAVLPVRGDLTWAVRSRSRLQDLVKYALSESHRQVRHALGLAI